MNWPHAWPLRQKGTITSPWGPRRVDGRFALHYGMDIVGRRGDDVLLPYDGVITAVYTDHPVFGGTIEWETDHQAFLFGHLDEIFVKVGQRLKAGTLIGLVGNTGLTQGSGHLHVQRLNYG